MVSFSSFFLAFSAVVVACLAADDVDTTAYKGYYLSWQCMDYFLCEKISLQLRNFEPSAGESSNFVTLVPTGTNLAP